MSLEIRTAKILAEGMRVLHEELLADLEPSEKIEYFRQAIQILLADANRVQTSDDMLALAQNIYRLAHETPELKAHLFGPAPHGKRLDFTARTEAEVAASEAENKKSREVAAGIHQQLLELVEDEIPPETNDREGLFNWLLGKLGWSKS